MTLKGYFKHQLKLIDAALKKTLPPLKAEPRSVHAAMRYSVLGGGKRFRPILVLAAAEACGEHTEKAIPAAVAVELIHAYSLIHDDLPCMDDDDWRRGKPSCHRKFGEAYAVLAGDALLTLAFEVLSRPKPSEVSQRLIQTLSHAAGSSGMIGGQAVEKWHEGKDMNLATLTYIHVNKTGQLIRACCQMGALSVQARPLAVRALNRYGEYLGVAFQIIDDIIDSDGYVKIASLKEAREEAEELIEKAKLELKPLGRRGERLKEIADFVLRRKH